MRKSCGGKGTRSERERATVMVDSINIQLMCHAPHIGFFFFFFNSILNSVYDHFFCFFVFLTYKWGSEGAVMSL